MEEIAVFEVLRRHILLIVALGVVTALAGYGVTYVPAIIPEKFETSALVLVRPHEPLKIEGRTADKEFLGFPVGQMAAVETSSKTFIQIIKSPALIEQIVRELHMDASVEMPISNTFWGQISGVLRPFFKALGEYANDAISLIKYGKILKDDPFAKAAKHVDKGLQLKSFEDTYVFEIDYGDDEPQKAAAVANTAAKLFISSMEKMRAAEALSISNHLKAELEKTRLRLESARQNLESYKSAHGIVLYDSEYASKLKIISDLQIEVAKLDEKLAATPGTFAAKAASAKRARLLQILQQLKAEVAGLPEIERQLKLLQTDVDIATTTYEIVAKDLKEAELRRLDPLPVARLVSQAGAPNMPTKPRRDLIAAAALFSGMLIGATLAFFLEYINRRVRSVRDVEEMVGLRVIGTIPSTTKSRPWWRFLSGTTA